MTEEEKRALLEIVEQQTKEMVQQIQDQLFDEYFETIDYLSDEHEERKTVH